MRLKTFPVEVFLSSNSKDTVKSKEDDKGLLIPKAPLKFGLITLSITQTTDSYLVQWDSKMTNVVTTITRKGTKFAVKRLFPDGIEIVLSYNTWFSAFTSFFQNVDVIKSDNEVVREAMSTAFAYLKKFEGLGDAKFKLQRPKAQSFLGRKVLYGVDSKNAKEGRLLAIRVTGKSEIQLLDGRRVLVPTQNVWVE